MDQSPKKKKKMIITNVYKAKTSEQSRIVSLLEKSSITQNAFFASLPSIQMKMFLWTMGNVGKMHRIWMECSFTKFLTLKE